MLKFCYQTIWTTLRSHDIYFLQHYKILWASVVYWHDNYIIVGIIDALFESDLSINTTLM